MPDLKSAIATPDAGKPVSIISSRASDSEFRHLANLTAAGIIGAAIVLIAIITFAATMANRSATERERILLQNAINRGILRALNEQKSVAWWDDAYTKTSGAGLDLNFIDTEFGIFLTETYGHDKIFILSPDDQPIYAYTGGARGLPSDFDSYRSVLEPIVEEARSGDMSHLAQRPDLFGETQGHYRTIGSPLQTARWTGHLISIDGKPAFVSAITIMPNIDMSLLKGTPSLLVSIIFVDDDYVGDIGRALLLPDLKLAAKPSEARDTICDPLDADDGSRIGYLMWTTARPGRVLTKIVLPLVIAGVLAVVLQATLMLRRLRSQSRSLALQEKRSRHAARHDALSGLPNRAHFADNLARVLQELATDTSGMRAIVAYIDVDRFKDVNDTLGHSAGDALIKQVAHRLQANVRSGDFIARYGGDEFAILWLSSDPRAPSILAERISRAFLNTIDIDGQSLAITTSIGIAVAPDNGTTVEDVMRHADIALYEAKNAGRNCAITFSEDMAQDVQERRAIELDLQTALAEDQFELAYQPIIASRTGAITGIEALLRWQHPARGFVSPGVFIPIAEQCGLMPQLGERVLARAMQDWHGWPHLEVSVNLSPAQFRQSDIAGLLERLAAKHAADPRHFVLEITEGVLMDAGERTRQILDAIRAMGFRMALDDFGTGYSSLAYLCNFRFDKIKIDRSFVSGLSRSQSFQTIVQAVISLGKGFGMTVVAEGVETESEVATMVRFGCSEMQGYYFARPMPREKLLELLRTHVAKPLMAPAREEVTSADDADLGDVPRSPVPLAG